MNTRTNKGISRALEWIADSIGLVQIIVSPLLIGLVVGTVIYFSYPTTVSLVIGMMMAVAGLVAGIFWARSVKKGRGGVVFISRVMATPELDQPDEGEDNEITTAGK